MIGSRNREMQLMYVWEMIACRLRGEGWSVWHTTAPDADEGNAFVVHFQRRGFAGQAAGATLTDAYAAAARQAHSHGVPVRAGASPHFGMMALAR